MDKYMQTSVFLQTMKYIKPFVLALCYALLIGCGEPAAKLESPKVYSSEAFTFNYPENWEVSDEASFPELEYIIIETPGDAIAVMQLYPQDYFESLMEYAESFSESAKENTPLGKFSDSKYLKLDESNGFSRIEEKFAISLLGETIAHTRTYGTQTIGNRALFVIFQVADEDSKKVTPGFDLIAETLQALAN